MAIYYVWSGATGSGNGSTWANAFTTLTLAFATEAAGDTLYVAHDHAESSATALVLTSSGTTGNLTKVVCVNRAGTVPPVSADRRATATVTTTGTVNITCGGSAHYDGIIFSAGTGSTSSANIVLATLSNSYLRYDNCSFRFPITSTTGGVVFAGGSGGALGGVLIELNNTTMSFVGGSSSSGVIQLTNTLRWRNTPSALLMMAAPTLLIATTGAVRGGVFECIGVDFSAMGSGKTLVNVSSNQGLQCRFIDCKLDAAVTKSAASPTGLSHEVNFIRCGATGNYRVYRQHGTGTLDEETTIVRTGGATDGTTPVSWKIVTASTCFYSMPFDCPPIAIWNDTTGSAVTATVEGIWGGGATPLDTECWVECEFLGDASSPQGSFAADCAADLLTTGTNQTTSSATWGGSTTKFKLAVTFTPQQKGWIYARVKCAKASSTFYVDPLVTLT